MYVPWAGLALLCFPSRHPDSRLPLASAFATSCPAHQGEVDVQFGLLADAASLGETDSVDRYLYTAWARGPSNSKRIASCSTASCEVSCLIMLSLMAPRVCTLVLSCSYVTFYIPLHSPAPPLYNCDEMYILCGFKVCRDSRCIHVRTHTDKSPTHVLTNICCE